MYLCSLFYRPLSEDEARIHTPVVISCNENKREVCAVQNIANKQIDRTFLFDKVRHFFLCLLTSMFLEHCQFNRLLVGSHWLLNPIS